MENQKKWKKQLFHIAQFFEESHVFGALRQGMLLLIPLVVVGSVVLMLKSLPIPSYQKVLPKLLNGRYLEFLDFVHAGTFSFFTIALTLTTSISYAMLEQKKENISYNVSECILAGVVALMSIAGFLGIQYEDFSIANVGTANTFTAVIVSLLSGYLYFAVRRRTSVFRKGTDTEADSVFIRAVQSILPAAVVVSFFALLNLLVQAVLGVQNIQEGLELAAQRFLDYFHGRFEIGLVVLVLIHIMCFFGIHGNNVLDTVLQKNYVAISNHDIWNKSFQDVFVIMGGTGALLSLLIALLFFTKNKRNRRLARYACPSVLMNISEVLAFGIPVVFNPIFFIPFLCVPIVNYLISYGAIYVGLVPHVVREVTWTTPVLLSGYQATGSVAGSVLQVVCVAAGVAIYLPFVHMFEEHQEKQMVNKVKQLVQELQREENIGVIHSLSEREDMLGGVARMLAAELEEAIEKKELFLVYQPQVDCNECCIGAEALIRWIHPVYGFIYPPLIIQLAKEKGLLHKLEEFIFDTAAEAIRQVEDQIGGELKISVNITNESLAWEGFEACIGSCVDRHHISREKLWLEITEQDALSSSFDIIAKIENLKEKGHRFLIDDFGMGHTSLLYLQTNYFGIVKLDGALTRRVLENERDGNIISSIVYLGQSLHFTIVAEYVETKEQRDKLAQIGVDAFQGYLYSKPLSLEELIPWMAQRV